MRADDNLARRKVDVTEGRGQNNLFVVLPLLPSPPALRVLHYHIQSKRI